MPDLSELKQQYNEVLAREKKAEVYLDNESIPYERRLKWYAEFVKILRKMNDLLALIGPCSREERINGFEV